MTAEEFKSLNVINGKWKSLIIYNLSDGRKRFTHLLRLTSGISQKVLCENLKDLENDNLIGKEYFYEYPQYPLSGPHSALTHHFPAVHTGNQ